MATTNTKSKKNLRHRSSLYENANIGLAKEEEKGAVNNRYNHMSYSRRNIATPFSRGGSNGNVFPKNKNLTSYRNKIVIILVLTSFYTTFLYRRGQ